MNDHYLFMYFLNVETYFFFPVCERILYTCPLCVYAFVGFVRVDDCAVTLGRLVPVKLGYR